MATTTIQRRSKRFAVSSRQVKETVGLSGLPQQASIVGRSMPNCEEQEWLTNLARLALLESIGSGSLASSKVVHAAFGSGAVPFEDFVTGQLGSLHVCSGWVESGQFANTFSVVGGSIKSGQGVFYSGILGVPVGSVILEGQSLISCHMVRLMESNLQGELVRQTMSPPSTPDYPIADFYKPVEYNWTESTYEVDQALRQYSENPHADR